MNTKHRSVLQYLRNNRELKHQTCIAGRAELDRGRGLRSKCKSLRDGPLEKLWAGGGGGGGEFFEPQEFFSSSNSLYEFFLCHSMNIS